MPTVSMGLLADEVYKLCKQHVDEITKETKPAVTAAANKTKEQLSQYNSKRGLGIYGKSWQVKTEGSELVGYTATVYSTMPGLPHLIEFGHGGPQPAPPHPHMDAAYEAGAEELMRRLGQ